MADIGGASPDDVRAALLRTGADTSFLDQALASAAPVAGMEHAPAQPAAPDASGFGSFADYLTNGTMPPSGPGNPSPGASGQWTPNAGAPAAWDANFDPMMAGAPQSPGPGASGEWTPDAGAPSPYSGNVVTAPSPAGASPVSGPPMMGAINPGMPTAPPGMPNEPMTAPNYAPLEQATQAVGAAQANTMNRQADAFDQGKAMLEAGDRRFQDQHQKIQDAYDAARKHAAQNPMQEWSTGHRIGTAIAVAMGAYGAAMTHTQNFALDTINKSIEQEIGRRRGLVSDLRDQLGDDRSAYSMAREQMLNQVKMNVDAITARAGSEEKKAQGQQLSAQLGVQAQQAKNEVINHQQDTALRLAGLDVQHQQIAASLMMKSGELAQKAQERFVPDVGVMRTDDDAKSAKDFMRSKADAEGAINDLIRMRSKYPSGTLPYGPDAALAERAATKLMLAQKQGMQLGTLSESDIKLLKTMAGGGGLSIWSRFDTVMAGLNAQKRDWQKKEDAWRGQAQYSIGGGQQRDTQQAAPSFKPVGAK